jgi:three-Cys-motif partner protein
MTSPLLLPEDDQLPMRESQEYIRYKLKALELYLTVTNTAMRDKEWFRRYYIDLQAGPGKNRVGSAVLIGSPLIALTVPHPATHLRFNEMNSKLNTALKQRVSASEMKDRVKLFQGDANVVVDDICNEIYDADLEARRVNKWSTLNVAFLDPEGLELHWATVEKLAKLKRMDLIINFSTHGIKRTIGKGYTDKVDLFFGTPDWKSVYEKMKSGQRRELIDFYRRRLEQFDYHIEIDPDLGGDYMEVRNSRNAEVYSMIFASKSELGEKFWRQSAKSAKPPRLPGF